MNPAEFATLGRAERELWWFRGMQRILFALLDSLVAARDFSCVLDAGCGTGYTAALLQERYGWRTFGADLSWEGVVQAVRTEGISPVQADVVACPFRSGSFDAVFSLDVLVHFDRGDEFRALAEFARVLRPGGLLVLRVSALDALYSRHSKFVHERQRFTRGRLVRAASSVGFRIVRCTYANALLLPVALARFRLWEPLTSRPPASGTGPLPKWIDRLLYSALVLEAGFISRGLNFPVGQSLILIGSKTANLARCHADFKSFKK